MDIIQERREQKEKELRDLEIKMNQAFAEMEELDAEIVTNQEPAENAERPQLENKKVEEEEFYPEGEEQLTEDEAVKFLGINPAGLPSQEIKLKEDIASRIKSWMAKGFPDKVEKEKLLKQIPRTGQLYLEAPTLNEEMMVDLHPKALAKDAYFKDYQNLTGSSLSVTSRILNSILNDSEEPLDREVILEDLSAAVKLLSHLFFSLSLARKSFLLGKYEDRIQKILRTVEPTTFLFGDNLKGLIESSKTMEKVSKDLKPKPSFPPKQSNTLNWKSPAARRDLGRGGFRNYLPRQNASRSTTNFNRPKPYPAKRNYTQTQQNRR